MYKLLGLSLGVWILLGSVPALAMTKPEDKVTVVQEAPDGQYTSYTKPFKELKLDAKTKDWIQRKNQSVDQEYLGNYRLMRVVIKNALGPGMVAKVVFINDYGDMWFYRLDKGKEISRCAIILSLNDRLGWCK